MDVLTKRPGTVAITAGLAAMTAVLGWFLVSASGRAQGVELTTAELVPQDSTVYVAFNTKLDSSEWIAAFDLVEKLGLEDPEDELIAAVEGEGGVDWEADVAPFLGGNAAVYLGEFDVSSDETPEQLGVIIRAADPERAMEVIFEQFGGDEADEFEYEGQAYYFVADPIDGDAYLARIGSHLVMTASESEMRRVIDVAQGRAPSLKDDSEFEALHDELTRNFLGFVYMDTEKLLGSALESGLGVFVEDEDELWQWGSSKTASVISAKDGGFVFQSAGQAETSPLSPLLKARDESRFAEMVPADAAMFFSVYDIAGAWDGVREAWGDYIDESIRSEGEYDSLDEALDEAAAEIGVDDIDKLIAHFNKEVAVALWFPTSADDAPSVAILAETEDEAAARNLLERATEDYQKETREVAGVTVTLGQRPGQDEFSYAVTDGYVVFGHFDSLRDILEGGGDSLADSARYRNAKETMGTRLGSFGYFDLSALIETFSGGTLIPDDEFDLGALQALMFTMVEDGGFTRFAGAVTIDD